MASSSGSARVAGLRVTTPLTATWPSTIRRSPPRREVTPAWARILLRRSFAMLGHTRQLWDDQLALQLQRIANDPHARCDQEIAGRVEEVAADGALVSA